MKEQNHKLREETEKAMDLLTETKAMQEEHREKWKKYLMKNKESKHQVYETESNALSNKNAKVFKQPSAQRLYNRMADAAR